MSSAPAKNVVTIGLSVAIVSMDAHRPRVLVVHHRSSPDALPFGLFDPLAHRTLESGLRSWVKEQTFLELGYAEQLYTFGDRGRHLVRLAEGPRVVSVGYLALTRAHTELSAPDTMWRDWYVFFPWEDWRESKPAIIDEAIMPAMTTFIANASPAESSLRRERVRVAFGFEGPAWDEEKVLERYELLYEAGLVEEAKNDGRPGAAPRAKPPLGASMTFDHRRILATAIARLRGKMKYRPVIFELLPPTFTLLELQKSVEAISGTKLHKQNFRRLVEDQGLVEGTGKSLRTPRGRPAELFRFRREVLAERPAPGVRFSGRRPAG
ncbi:MAG: NAD regulator [Rhizomicrobium sp.]|jgi:hypothetical protein